MTDARSAAGLLALDRTALTIVAGLETLNGPRELAEIVKLAGCEHVVFSLDLFDGKPIIAAPEVWTSADPLTLANEAIAVGIRQILLLELSRVGTGRGPGTERALHSEFATPIPPSGFTSAAEFRGSRRSSSSNKPAPPAS